jgi:alpha-L-fucosidase
MPAMADAPLRGYNGRHEWFWEPGDEAHIFPTDKLVDMYYKSVGRNATLILGLTPDNRGLIPDQDAQRLTEFGQVIQKRFAVQKGAARGAARQFIIKLPKSEPIQELVIQEKIQEGQRVRAFKIDALVKGKWQTLVNGSAIGHKFLYRLDQPVSASKIRLQITEAEEEPIISNFAVF